MTLVDKSPVRVRRMFDAIAPWYDFLNHFLSLGIDRSWRRKAARLLLDAATPPGPVLDVCCGTGDLTFEFLKRLRHIDKLRDELRDFFGIDFSEEMLQRGRCKLEKRRRKLPPGVGEIRLEVGDALNLPFEDGQFALVAVAFGLRNVGETQRALAEMLRVCRPGGSVAILEFSMPTLPVLAGLYRFYFRSVLPRLGQWFSRNNDDAYRYLPESVSSFDTPQEIGDRLRELGLTEIRSLPMTFGIATLTWAKVSTA